MSLFDKGYVRSLCNQSSNSGKSRNNQNNNRRQSGNNKGNGQNQHRTGKAAKERKQKDLAEKAASILRRFDSEDAGEDGADASTNKSNSPVNDVKEVLSAFVRDFNKSLDKPVECKELIEDNIGDICAALKYYFDPKFEDALPEMNKTLDVMSTNHFATILLNVLKQNPFGDEWDEMWKDVAFAISILLDSSANKMKEGTIQIYVTDILSSNGMWRTEIRQLVDELGITEDLAIDLIVGLPVKPDDMTDLIMRHTYKSFLWAIMNHAEENIEVLDRNTQRKLFDFFFDDSRGKLACKVIGRFLSDRDALSTLEVRGEEPSASASLVYGEFKAMLMERLECYDVNNITFVLRFIVDQKKRGKSEDIIFNAEDAAKYDTIRKAIMKVVAQDESAKPYLV